MNWPKSAGTAPWLNGKGDQVKITRYIPGGVVSAAPDDEDRFHGHFGVGGVRVLAIPEGHLLPTVEAPGSEVVANNEDIKMGGKHRVCDEDLMVREIAEEGTRARESQIRHGRRTLFLTVNKFETL